MHMADALLSPAVGASMIAVSTAANAYAVRKIKRDEFSEKKIPLMGVMGAFVFTAQMINFTIPGTGSSGHIGGGILLAAMIGGYPALLSMSAVLIIQSLFFADGGLLALGANIFNMGVIPCLVVYPLIFRPLMKKGMSMTKITLASILAVVASLQLGAFSVVVQTSLSGITQLPFSSFLLLMQPIHLAIGVMEGVITAAVLCFVYQMRPEILESTYERKSIGDGIPMKGILITLVIFALLVGGVLSVFASSYPDGLEWASSRVAGTTGFEASSPILEQVADVQDSMAILPNYEFRTEVQGISGTGTSLSGIVGGIFTFALAGIAGFSISKIKKKQKDRLSIE